MYHKCLLVQESASFLLYTFNLKLKLHVLTTHLNSKYKISHKDRAFIFISQKISAKATNIATVPPFTLQDKLPSVVTLNSLQQQLLQFRIYKNYPHL